MKRRANPALPQSGQTHLPQNRNRPCDKEYASHVEHPRYGKAPRFTGLDPNPNSPTVHLNPNNHPLTKKQLQRIESLLGWRLEMPDDGTTVVHGTAITADISRQTPATMQVSHYFDVDKICRDCGRRFIFFAEEQKHWYEELGFPLEANAVRCPPCRKQLQNIASIRKRYECLFHLPARSLDETLVMAGCCLTLIQEGLFHLQQTQRVRTLLNSITEERRSDSRYVDLVSRLHTVETHAKSDQK